MSNSPEPVEVPIRPLSKRKRAVAPVVPLTSSAHPVNPTPDFKSRVKQTFKADADINTIISRFHKTGQLPPGPPPVFDDGTFLSMSLTERINLSRDAQAQFDSLPLFIRKRFPSLSAICAASADQIQAAITLHDSLSKPPAPAPAAPVPAPAPSPSPSVPPKP